MRSKIGNLTSRRRVMGQSAAVIATFDKINIGVLAGGLGAGHHCPAFIESRLGPSHWEKPRYEERGDEWCRPL